jgi:pyrroloquinoline quinone (PQQ) biosynthesis protein C
MASPSILYNNLAGGDTVSSLFLENLKYKSIFETIKSSNLPNEVKEFLEFTFRIIEEGKPHKVAAAFTFGRENLIPSMFTAILRNFQKNFPEQDISKLIYYFERHIELDEDEHGPMALQMINELANGEPKKWKEIEQVSIEALEKRIKLWDSIENIIVKKKVLV